MIPSTEPRATRSPIYYGTDPQQWDDFVYGLEKLGDTVHEISNLHEQHYDETEAGYKDLPLDPDYERAIQTERAGQFVLFTARDLHFRMVGYLMYYVSRSMHNKTVFQATEAGFFIEKQCRREGVGQRLLTYAEAGLGELDVAYVSMTSKAPVGGTDLNEFLVKNNYRKVAIEYQKRLPDMKAAH